MDQRESGEDGSGAVQERLSRFLRVPLTVVITDNTRSMVSVKRKNHGYAIRLHHMFLHADESVLKSLADYISGNLGRVKAQLRAFINSHKNKIRKPSPASKPRRPAVMPLGEHFDLQQAFDRLNCQYFQGEVDCAITWGNRRRPGRKSIRLGSYCQKTNVIRINRVLDRAPVPSYVVDEVIHHEMVHHRLGPERSNGRTLYHHRRFKEVEGLFVHKREARLWLKKNLHRLLTP